MKTKKPAQDIEVLPSEKKKTSVRPKRKSSSVAISDVDPIFQSYIREISKYPILTREQERELAIKYRETHDREAFQSLVTANLRFVVKIAFEYLHYRLKLLDLIQEGNMGLVKAVQDFDPYKDVRLTTYAVWWIRSYIQDALLRNHSLVKMGTTQAQKKLFYRLRRETRELEKMGITGDRQVKLLAEKLDVKEHEVTEMAQRLSGHEVSFDEPKRIDGGRSLNETMSDHSDAMDERLGNEEQRLIFNRILDSFSKTIEGRDKDFFEKRLIAEKPTTLQELGQNYGVSKERARQIEEQVKEKLRLYVEKNYPDFTAIVNPSTQE